MLTSRHEISGLLTGHSIALVLLYSLANPADSTRTFRTITAINRRLPDMVPTVLTSHSVSGLLTFWLVTACVRFSGALSIPSRGAATLVASSAAFAVALIGWTAARSSTGDLGVVLAATAAGSLAGACLTAFEDPSTRSSVLDRQRWQKRYRFWCRGASVATASVLLIAIVGAPVFVFPDVTRTSPHPDAVVVLGPATAERIEDGIHAAERSQAPTVAVSSSLRSDGSFAAPQCSNPASVDVLCFVAAPFSTAGEMKSLNALSREFGWKDVILLTATPHVARAAFIADRCLAARAAVRAADGPRSFTDWTLAYLYQSLAFMKIVLSGPCS
ncbi:hypothetical protein MT349_03900 [Rathayibacter caricis]|uniref:hypothetical protein n=1 Tax=Rathayibacter caricis TaxID=110936 RepID=UPI001FB3BCDB|nr:hypothetical protein [Rathayibacter caricis]MCJ1694914.1 hypothetical protein [Rathayibacter caricis]